MAFNVDQGLVGGVQAQSDSVAAIVHLLYLLHSCLESWTGTALEPILAMGPWLFCACVSRLGCSEMEILGQFP